MRVRTSLTLCAVAVLALAADQPAQAAVALYWDNVGGTANDWGQLANWSTVTGGGTTPAALPNVSDVVEFNAASLTTVQTVNLIAGRSVLGLSFTSNVNVSLQSGGNNRTLTLGANGITGTGTGAYTIGSATDGQRVAVSLTDDQTWANNSASGGAITVVNGVMSSTAVNRLLTLAGTNANSTINKVSGIIADNGAGVMSVTKSGNNACFWELGGVNTFTGQLTVESGTLQATSANNAGTTGVLGNSALSVILGKTGGVTGTFRLTGSGVTATTDKGFTMATGGTGGFLVDSGNTLNLRGVIDGSGGLKKNGPGTLVFSGTSANTYGGLTTVDKGTLQLGKSGAVNAIANGGLTIGGASATVATVQYTGASSDMMDAGAVTINGKGQLDFNGATDTIGNVSIESTSAGSGSTPITSSTAGGVLTIGALGITPAAGYLTTINPAGSTLKLGGTVTFTAAGTGHAAITGNLDLNGTRTFNIGAGTGTGYDLDIRGTVSNGTVTMSTGTGRLQLSGANTYSGATTISAGTLQLAVSGSIANSPTITVGSSAVLEILSTTWALAPGQTIKGTGTITGSMIVASGSFLSPGTSPGALAETGTQTWAGGGTYVWEVDQVNTGTVLQPGKGVDPGHDFLNITGTLAITATSASKYIIDVNGLLHTTHALGAVDGWDNTKSYTWVIATASDGISGFDADKFDIQTGNFTGNNTPDPAAQWKIARSGDTKSVELQYVAPEPATMALLALGGVGLLVRRRCRA